MVTKQSHVPTGLENNLVSLGKLCNDGCNIIIKKYSFLETNNRTKILQGPINQESKLWQVNIGLEIPNKISNNIIIMETKPDSYWYYHRPCFSPILSTFMKDHLNGHYTTCAGFAYDILKKHIYNSTGKKLGHMHQKLKDTQSTNLKWVYTEGYAPRGIPTSKNQVFVNTKDVGKRTG